MVKTFACRDVGVDCDYVARGETESIKNLKAFYWIFW